MLNKNIRSGVPKAARMTRQKQKQKNKMEKKLEERGKKKDKTKWSGNQNTMRGFTPYMQVLEAPENTGALDR